MSTIGKREHDHLHCIYFYYVKILDGKTDITAYYHFDENTPIRDKPDLIRIVRQLGQNARIPDHAPPPCGTGFSAVPWRRKSYFVVLIDHKTHIFENEKSFNIVFKDGKEKENHSFFNAQKLNIDLSYNSSGDMVTAVCCVNLMRHVSGRDLQGKETEPYSVSLSPKGLPMLHYRNGTGGTNQGGPLPPPAPM